MKRLYEIFRFLINKPSILVFIFLIGFTIDRTNRWVDFGKSKFPFENDVEQYYSYLPAAFIYHDLSFSFPNEYWRVKAPNGKLIPKGTFGMSILYSPFFFIGHTIAKNTGYAVDGYSMPYKWCIHLGSILMSLMGLWFCRKSLLLFFNESITAITLICIFLGTNLFYYTYGFGEMPHSYLFFLFSLFIFLSLKWYKEKKYLYFILFSFVAGFATLVRPSECVMIFFPFFIGISGLRDFKERIKLILLYRIRLVLAVITFFIPFFLQMIYWKVYAGQFLFFSYGEEERFFFNDPKILEFLFSFRKGWLLYTPMMAFSLIGIFFLSRKDKGISVFILCYISFMIYILSSWWDWPFGGSFGCRVLIQHYAFLAFGLAAFINAVFEWKSTKRVLNYTIRIALCSIFILLINFNYRQSWQYKYGLIHYCGMTKEAYFYVLSKDKLSPEEFKNLEKMIDIPDYKGMLKGKRDI